MPGGVDAAGGGSNSASATDVGVEAHAADLLARHPAVARQTRHRGAGDARLDPESASPPRGTMQSARKLTASDHARKDSPMRAITPESSPPSAVGWFRSAGSPRLIAAQSQHLSASSWVREASARASSAAAPRHAWSGRRSGGRSAASVRAGVRGRLALCRLLRRRLAVLRRGAVLARERGRDNGREAAADQESDEQRAHDCPPLPASGPSVARAERRGKTLVASPFVRGPASMLAALHSERVRSCSSEPWFMLRNGARPGNGAADDRGSGERNRHRVR